MKPGTPLLLAALSVGCGTTPQRVTRVLFAARGLAVSNSPMLATPREPHLRGGRLSVSYSVLFENVEDRQFVVELAHATVTVGPLERPARCAVLGRQLLPAFLVEPGARWRVDCIIDFDPVAARLRELGDTEATLTIPVSLDGREAPFRFPYRFRPEDAS